MRPSPQENLVRGSHPVYSGRVEGETQGWTLVGHRIAGKRIGGITVALLPDGRGEQEARDRDVLLSRFNM